MGVNSWYSTNGIALLLPEATVLRDPLLQESTVYCIFNDWSGQYFCCSALVNLSVAFPSPHGKYNSSSKMCFLYTIENTKEFDNFISIYLPIFWLESPLPKINHWTFTLKRVKVSVKAE